MHPKNFLTTNVTIVQWVCQKVENFRLRSRAFLIFYTLYRDQNSKLCLPLSFMEPNRSGQPIEMQTRSTISWSPQRKQWPPFWNSKAAAAPFPKRKVYPISWSFKATSFTVFFHSNGFGHLLSINGIESGSVLTGHGVVGSPLRWFKGHVYITWTFDTYTKIKSGKFNLSMYTWPKIGIYHMVDGSKGNITRDMIYTWPKKGNIRIYHTS